MNIKNFILTSCFVGGLCIEGASASLISASIHDDLAPNETVGILSGTTVCPALTTESNFIKQGLYRTQSEVLLNDQLWAVSIQRLTPYTNQEVGVRLQGKEGEDGACFFSYINKTRENIIIYLTPIKQKRGDVLQEHFAAFIDSCRKSTSSENGGKKKSDK